MRFMMMTTETGQNPDESLYVEMAKFIDEMTKSGVLIATGGLDPKVTEIRSSGGKITVTDGPYSEAKEAVVFAFLGFLTILGEPGNLPAATGARGPRVLGHITPA